MRLICPSCEANYEVDDRVIPDDGRDVQCSNCGHTWFQKSARMLAEEEAAAAPAIEPDVTEEAATPAETDPEPAPEPAFAPVEPEPELEPEIEEPDTEPDVWAQDDSEDEETVSANDIWRDDPETEEEPAPEPEPEEELSPAPQMQRRPLDAAVQNILREEADHETRAREAEGFNPAPADIAPQPTPAGDAPELASPTSALDSAISAMLADEGNATEVSNRRDLLPDIEEINSSLRSASDRDDLSDPEAEAAMVEARERSRYRAGFILMLVLFGIAALVYAMAPTIEGMYPAAGPALAGYVDFVNSVRIGLDAALLSAVDGISGMLDGG